MAALLALMAVVAAPTPATACSGGIDLAWAIRHATGDIIIGKVTSARTLDDFTHVLEVEVDDVIRGHHQTTIRVRGAMGAVCEQSADVGETILVLTRIRGARPPHPIALFYVVGGQDGYPRSRVAALLANLPDTGTVPLTRTETRSSAPVSAICLLAGLIGAVAAGRRLEVAVKRDRQISFAGGDGEDPVRNRPPRTTL